MLSKIFTTRHDDELAHKDALLREALPWLLGQQGFQSVPELQNLIARILSELAQNKSPASAAPSASVDGTVASSSATPADYDSALPPGVEKKSAC